MSSHSCEGVSWIVLLEGANKLGLNTFCTAIGDYLIKQHEQWIKQNILTVYNYAASTNSLQRLVDFCNQLMLSSPDIILKSDNMADLPKAIFIGLLKNDELNMDEGDVWMSAVQWAINQISGVTITDNPANWSSTDVNAVKNTLAECIPHIRFFNISSEAFNEKVVPYIELLPRELRSDLLYYHLQNNYKPKTQMLPQRKGQLPDVDSVVINKQQASCILQKIAESTQSDRVEQVPARKQIAPYKLILLYRESRDNSNNNDEKTMAKKFRQMCTNKGPTVAVGRVKDTEEILGGYNPLSWGTGDNRNRYVSTRESFIFSLNKDDIEKSIVSFVKNEQKAIFECSTYLPNFGNCALFFGGYCGEIYKPVASISGSCYQIPIRSTEDRFTWVDWEVFSVDKLIS